MSREHHRLSHRIANRFIEGLDPVGRELLSVYPRYVLGRIQPGWAGWGALVAELIKSRKLLQYQEPS